MVSLLTTHSKPPGWTQLDDQDTMKAMVQRVLQLSSPEPTGALECFSWMAAPLTHWGHDRTARKWLAEPGLGEQENLCGQCCHSKGFPLFLALSVAPNSTTMPPSHRPWGTRLWSQQLHYPAVWAWEVQEKRDLGWSLILHYMTYSNPWPLSDRHKHLTD